jgi:hypothetical protein
VMPCHPASFMTSWSGLHGEVMFCELSKGSKKHEREK